jgi:hypothetical protein
MVKRVSDEVWKSYRTLNTEYIDNNLPRNHLSSLGVTLEEHIHTEHLKSALTQLISLIKNETKDYPGIKLAAFELYDEIYDVILENLKRIDPESKPLPYTDQKYFCPVYVGLRIKELKAEIKEQETIEEPTI